MANNRVTVNDPEDHVLYRHLKTGQLFKWIYGSKEGEKRECPLHCMRIGTGYIWLDTGMADRWEGIDPQKRNSRCKLIKSVTIESSLKQNFTRIKGLSEMSDNSVTINDPDDHVFYNDLKTCQLFTWVHSSKEIDNRACMKIGSGYVWLDTGEGYYHEAFSSEDRKDLKCKLIKSVTIESS